MNATELTTLSMSELKAFCTSHAIDVVGDKRSKATYINAIESFQSQQTVTEIETPDPFENHFELAIDLPLAEAAEMAERSITTPLLTDLPPVPTNQHRQASIVVLIPLILLSLAIISIRIGIGALIPLIAAVGRLSVSIWQSIPRTLDPGSIPIEYFPA